MYRVLIVDDEPMIRLGLASTVDWEKDGLELVGQAANGEEALRQAGGGIDILITDIKMPLMDGLELTRRLKERNPLIRVILISSYSDFEFAREAVKLGVVVDYLLKPTMEPEDLQRILRTCKRQLAEEKRKIEAEQKFGSERNRDRLKRFASVLKKRLSGHADVPAWQPPWLGEHLLVAVWSLDTGEQDSHDAMEHLLKLEHALEKLAEWEERSVSFLTGETELTMLLNDDRHDGLSRIGQWHRRLVDRGISFTVGVSPDFHSLDTFADAYEWAGYALEQSFFMGKGRCYQGEIMRRVNESANPGNSGRWPRLREQFSGAMAGGNRAESAEALRDIFQMWHLRAYGKDEVMGQAESLLTMLWSRQYALKTEEMMNRILDRLKEVRRRDTLQSLVAYLENQYEAFWEMSPLPMITDEDAKGVHVIQLALSYIQEHYREDLSLQEVADHVHMSKNYFSEQFKKRTGLNFIDFVIRLRIHHAKRLLRTTSLKVQEIGEKSGFNSPKHFLKIFKREVKCTPVEYRQRYSMKTEEETL